MGFFEAAGQEGSRQHQAAPASQTAPATGTNIIHFLPCRGSLASMLIVLISPQATCVLFGWATNEADCCSDRTA